MEIRRLRYFLQIAEEGSLGRASEVLGVAQPALSRQMRQLEQSLGKQLFVRSKRGMSLTKEGEQLRITLSKPMREVELALQNIGAPLAPISGAFSLGIAATAIGLLGAPLLTRLKVEFPKVRFHILNGEPEKLIDGLVRGEIDAALVPGPLPDERIFDRSVISERLLLVGGPDSPLAADTPVKFRDLSRYPMAISSARPHGIRALLDKTALRVATYIDVVAEIDSLEFTKDFVHTNAAFTVLPYSAFAREIGSGRLRYAPIDNPRLEQTLMFAVRQRLMLSRSFVAEIGTLLWHEVARLVESGAWPATRLDPPGDAYGE